MNYLIVGSGPAGVTAAETIREQDPDGSITIIGDEDGMPYARMAIPYLLVGKIDEQGTLLRQSSTHYDNYNIQYLQGRVESLLADEDKVRLVDGSSLAFDRLLIATGSRPRVPDVPGIAQANVTSCWTMEDARRIIANAPPGSKIVLLGAGFIGCIIMEALIGRGVDLTVVEMGDRMVPRMLDDKAGGILKSWSTSKGVTVITSAQITGIESKGSDSAMRLSLDSGEVLAADLLVTATGVIPNVGFLTDSGVDIDQGILVDASMQTNRQGVYAAGDVAQGLDLSLGANAVQAIQPTAVEHGRIAALNMTGSQVTHKGTLAMNVLDTMGLQSYSFGNWAGGDGIDSTELFDPENYQYLNLQFDGNVLVGATQIGSSEHIGVLHGLIRGRVDVGKWKDRLIANPTRYPEAYIATTLSL